jgi:TPR repeat protein
VNFEVNGVNDALASSASAFGCAQIVLARIIWLKGHEMACVDVDALAQYEADAKSGRADALYNLGLAYSTGQGVVVDFVAAHKWFNLAAMRGIDQAKDWRATISREMNSSQIAEALRQAREWLSVTH